MAKKEGELVKKITELKNKTRHLTDGVKAKIKESIQDLKDYVEEEKVLLKKLVIGVGIATIVLTISGVTISNNIYDSNKADFLTQYATSEELHKYSESLECDSSHVLRHNNEMLRMMHNNGEPIYVCIDKTISSEERQIIKESLDKYFGIVGSINDKYYYEIVDKHEYNLKANKTRVYFNVDKLEGSVSGIMNCKEQTKYYDEIAFMTDYVVTYDFEKNKLKNNSDSESVKLTNEQVLRYTIEHEIVHLFGIGDVYDTNKYNSFLHVESGFRGVHKELTPNDIKCLIMLYADKTKIDSSNIEEYYAEILDDCYDKYTNYIAKEMELDQNFEEDNFIFEGKIRMNGDEGWNNFYYIYKVEVENGHYEFSMTNGKDNSIIKSCSGNARVQNGIVLLENLHMCAGLIPEFTEQSLSRNVIDDFVIAIKEGKTVFMETFASSREIRGNIQLLEKEATI